MSPLRFKRLLAANEDQDLMAAFRRAVTLVGARNIDVGDVAASFSTGSSADACAGPSTITVPE